MKKKVAKPESAWAMWHPWKDRPFVGLDAKRDVHAYAIYRSRPEALKVCAITHDDARAVRVLIVNPRTHTVTPKPSTRKGGK